jgi:hypothetical protein
MTVQESIRTRTELVAFTKEILGLEGVAQVVAQVPEFQHQWHHVTQVGFQLQGLGKSPASDS